MLPRLLDALSKHPTVKRTGVQMWYVQAIACIIKVLGANESMDLLLASGCKLGEDMYPGGTFSEVTATDAIAFFDPKWSSRAVDCVLLTHEVQLRLGRAGPTTAFTVAALVTLRLWAKRRHVYGTRYGFPGQASFFRGGTKKRPASGGCAWMVR